MLEAAARKQKENTGKAHPVWNENKSLQCSNCEGSICEYFGVFYVKSEKERNTGKSRNVSDSNVGVSFDGSSNLS